MHFKMKKMSSLVSKVDVLRFSKINFLLKLFFNIFYYGSFVLNVFLISYVSQTFYVQFLLIFLTFVLYGFTYKSSKVKEILVGNALLIAILRLLNIGGYYSPVNTPWCIFNIMLVFGVLNWFVRTTHFLSVPQLSTFELESPSFFKIFIGGFIKTSFASLTFFIFVYLFTF